MFYIQYLLTALYSQFLYKKTSVGFQFHRLAENEEL